MTGLVYDKHSVKIYNDDFLNPDRQDEFKVDLTVTSPPYNLGIEYDAHNDSSSYLEYITFSKKYLERVYTLTNDTGRFCLNIPLDKNKGGQQSILADVTKLAKKVGWKYHSTIIWNEGTIKRRTAWGSWKSASAPYVIAPIEVILVLYKNTWKKNQSGKISTINRNEFIQWTNGVWTFRGEKRWKSGHPAAFPRDLPKRCIKLFSFEGDVVLDPFCGSGTTLVEAAENKRIAIGFDISGDYCNLAIKRITEWKALSTRLF